MSCYPSFSLCPLPPHTGEGWGVGTEWVQRRRRKEHTDAKWKPQTALVVPKGLSVQTETKTGEARDAQIRVYSLKRNARYVAACLPAAAAATTRPVPAAAPVLGLVALVAGVLGVVLVLTVPAPLAGAAAGPAEIVSQGHVLKRAIQARASPGLSRTPPGRPCPSWPSGLRRVA